MNPKHTDYTSVTETPNDKASQEQLNNLYTRYTFAAEYCGGKDVLEVACGAGQGLGLLLKTSKQITGCDIDKNNLAFAQRTYEARENISLKVADAQSLPFGDCSFDVVILFEAIYYLELPERFVAESYRVLREGGVIIICNANKDWSGFNPSPHSYRYFSASELKALLTDGGFHDIELYRSCPAPMDTAKSKIISLIKRIAVKFHLIPKTMKGKELLKRIFMGKLRQIPNEVTEGCADYTCPSKADGDTPVKDYKIIFALGHK